MKPTALTNALRAYSPQLRDNGATAVFLFGSRARGAERPDSDLDLFIDYDPNVKVPNLIRLMQIEDEIAQTLGFPVTITTRAALHPAMREGIEKYAVRIM